MTQVLEINRRWDTFKKKFDQDLEAVADIFLAFGELLVPLFGWDVTDAFFKSVYASASISLPEVQGFGPTTVANATDFSLTELKKTDTYRFIEAVHLYAYWGLESAPDGIGRWEDSSQVESFRETSKVGVGFFWFLTNGNGKLADALRAANARRVIDSIDQPFVTPLELAALARIDIKTLRNSLTPSGRQKSGLRVDPEGNVLRDSAKTWLLARNDFLPTIYETVAKQSASPAGVIGTQKDLAFIPVSEDGSAFTPNVCREGKYYIETPDGETAFGSYVKALNVLSIMAVPTWRRPGAKGRWGLVRGNAWRRVTKAELEIAEEKK